MDEMRFVVRIFDTDTVERLENEDDTIFAYRIKSLIVEELKKYNCAINSADIHVNQQNIYKGEK